MPAGQPPTISPESARELDAEIHELLAGNDTSAVFCLATSAKETIYSYQEGVKIHGDDSSPQVEEDTVLELWSQTKLVTSLAALLLVDRGLVSLDSEQDVEKYLPELGQLPVIKGYEDNGSPILEKARKKITLRMLLTHTAGFSYEWWPSIISRYHKLYPEDVNTLAPTATFKTILKPLVFEPGTSWAYSTSIIAAGKLIERVSGLRLDAYFQQRIFEPLGITSMTFFPTDEVKSKKMGIAMYSKDGRTTPFPSGFANGRATNVDEVSTELLLAGEGLYGTQRDFLRILRAILQSDPSSPYRSETPLISADSYRELFTGCVPTEEARGEMLLFGAGPLTHHGHPGTPSSIDHSVGLAICTEDLPVRRRKGSGGWYGAANTHYWIDPTTGIAGICATQIISFFPIPFWELYAAYEKELYAKLGKGQRDGALQTSHL